MINKKRNISMKKFIKKLSQSRKEDLAVCFIGVGMVFVAAMLH